MTSFVDLHRANFLSEGVDDRLNYLSAHYKNIKFQISPSFQYTVRDNSNSFGIAFEVYGDKDYWWVICQYTGILDPISDLVPGKILYLPELADINEFLTSIDTNTSDNTVVI